MKSPITKLTATTVIIIIIVFMITFFDRAATPVYALEQTTKANHTIKTIHLRMFRGGASTESNEFMDCWAKYDDAGWVTNFRRNFYGDVRHDDANLRFTVWNEGMLKTWMPLKNVVINIRINNEENYWEHFAKNYDPKLLLERLYGLHENKAIELEIDEPARGGGPIYVKAINSVEKTRLELVVDSETKLVKQFSRYRLGERDDELDFRIEYLAYNKPIDPSVFRLGGIPDDAKVIDQVDQLAGLEKVNLTNNEIATKVVRESLRATIEKDYEEVSRLMVGEVGDTIKEFIEEEFGAKLVRVISIGQPKPHTIWPNILCVPSEIEIEDEGGAKWAVNIMTTAKTIGYQPGNQWIGLTDLEADTQDRTAKGIIVPGERVGDFTLGMSKDEVLRRLGKPKIIHWGRDEYTLNNLPIRYRMYFGHISFEINYNEIQKIIVMSPSYTFDNGLGVGDAKETIIQTFGNDFYLDDGDLIYAEKGLQFDIDQDSRTVGEICITQARRRQTIVPGVGIGEFTLGMSKDEVLRRLGKPVTIYSGNEWYTLDNLPREYRLHFGDIEFGINDNAVERIMAQSPSYTFTNGLGVGDSEDRIKKAFGSDFDDSGHRFSYDDKGVEFEINRKNRTVSEIIVFRPADDQNESAAPNSDNAARSHNPLPGPLVFPKIDRRPQPDNDDRPEEMKRLPKYNPGSHEVAGLRGRDLSKLDLRDSFEDLMYIEFDDRTVWPASGRMPSGFDPQRIMELGKNPGLGIRSLHKQGITGRGVRIAILDQPLLVDHQEYADRLQLYEEIHIKHGLGPASHGCMTASVAVGKTVGVAPEAELFFIGQYNFDWEKKEGDRGTFQYLAQGIHRIVEINEQLPQDKKIRAISISRGWTPSMLLDEKYNVITEAVQKARAAGMLVVTCSVGLVHEGCDYAGLGRPPLADPDVFESYEPVLWAAESFWDGHYHPYEDSSEGVFFVPLDSRTTASEDGIDEYVFDRGGGFSKAPPYTAGIYALAVQVDPAITPERFWALAARTGRTIEVERNGKKRRLGPIIDPVRLIRSIEAGELANVKQSRSSDQSLPTPSQKDLENKTIVPGVGIGEFTPGMSKDDVLKELGEPDAIQLGEDEVVHRGDEKYTLNSLPSQCILIFGDILFWIGDDLVNAISVCSPRYRLGNGLAVGDSEQRFKQAFGGDFKPREGAGRNFLLSRAKGFGFVIQKNQTVAEIVVFKPDVDASDKASEQEQTILPGVRIGDITLGISKDEVLKKLGKPRLIYLGGERYTLDNLPGRYGMNFGHMSVFIVGDAVQRIDAHEPLYTFTNGLRVGDSEDKIKQALGSDFEFEESTDADFLSYNDQGVRFTVRKKDKTIEEIQVFPPTDDHGETDAPDRPQRKQDDRSRSEVYDGDDLKAYEGVDDLSAHDLRYAGDILDTLSFDQETLWPPSERLPEGFDPQTLLQEGMNPGLGVRALHAQGITGAGVHVGLIDQPLLLDHPEYAGKIVSYHHPGFEPHQSSGHGPAMASLLVGERCGTAPGAKLHVVAVPSWNRDAGCYARALDQFVEYNKNAPKEQTIRVVSVSCQPSGEGSVFNNQPLWDQAIQRAQAQGILVLDCTWRHGFVSLCWLDPQDRENVEACTPGFRNGTVEVDEGHIHVPAKPRTWARAPEGGPFGYSYDGGGRRSRRPKAKNGYSPTIPYAAGILALGWQIRPELTPTQMKELLFESAYIHESGAKIINPKAFIELVRKQTGNPVSEGVCNEDSETQTIVPGVGVGDTEEAIKQAFGQDFQQSDNFLKYEDEGLEFEIDEETRAVEEISLSQSLSSDYIAPSHNPLPGAPLFFQKLTVNPSRAA